MGNFKLEKPKIFEYDDYRIFLADLLGYLKNETSESFSHRYIAQQLGFKSSSTVKAILDGQRNIKNKTILKICDLFKLNNSESSYFEALVHFNQSTEYLEKSTYALRLVKEPGYKKANPLAEAQSNAYSNWYYFAIRELVNLSDFQDNAYWISKKLVPNISEIEAKKAIYDLIKLGLLKRDEEGRLQQTSPVIETSHDAIVVSLAKNFHRQMLERAAESMDNFTREQREISATTLSLSEAAMNEMRVEFLKFREKLNEIAANDDKNSDNVVQFNFQLFPLTSKKSGGK